MKFGNISIFKQYLHALHVIFVYCKATNKSLFSLNNNVNEMEVQNNIVLFYLKIYGNL